jgi:hypothetical protein
VSVTVAVAGGSIDVPQYAGCSLLGVGVMAVRLGVLVVAVISLGVLGGYAAGASRLRQNLSYRSHQLPRRDRALASSRTEC